MLEVGAVVRGQVMQAALVEMVVGAPDHNRRPLLPLEEQQILEGVAEEHKVEHPGQVVLVLSSYATQTHILLMLALA